MLEEKDITKHCDSRVLRRARNIARATDSIHSRKCQYEPQSVGRFKLKARVVSGQDWRQSYDVEVDVDELEHKIRSYDCTCQAALSQMGMCKHVAAAALAFVANPETYLGYDANRSAASSDGIVKLLEAAKADDSPASSCDVSDASASEDDYVGDVRLEVTLVHDAGSWGVRFRVGDRRVRYAIKDLDSFVSSLQAHQWHSYGNRLAFVHELNAFANSSRPVVSFIEKCVSIRRELENDQLSGFSVRPVDLKGELLLSGPEVVELLNICTEVDVFVDDLNELNHKPKRTHIVNGNPPVRAVFEAEPDGGFTVRREGALSFVEFAGDFYVWYGGVFYRCEQGFDRCRDFLRFVYCDPSASQYISAEDANIFCTAVLPTLDEVMEVVEPPEMQELKPVPCVVEFYFDYARSSCTCVAQARYGDERINLFEDPTTAPHVLSKGIRDSFAEQHARSVLARYFPVVEGVSRATEEKPLKVSDSSDIARLLFRGMPELKELGDIFTTPAFDRLVSKRVPRVVVGLSIKSNLIDLRVSSEDFDSVQLASILSSYRQKKRFHRLSDGTFIDLKEGNLEQVDALLEEVGVEPGQIAGGEVFFEPYRVFQLDALVDDKNKTSSFKKMLNSHEGGKGIAHAIPEHLEGIMRPYQVEGFEWVNALVDNGFGGILADEMGLGKSLQLISFLDARYSENVITQPSLIVCPASLVYNWLAEFQKFSCGLRVAAIVGMKDERTAALRALSLAVEREDEHPQILVTSYDLLKRDLDEYSSIPFFCVALDEAQYIKNTNTQASKAVKALIARHKLALTGTPVENRLSELWSIFDFLMPGLLGSYRQFRDRYEQPILNGDAHQMDKLQSLVSRFILRRLKKDVLKELPNKNENIVFAQMDEKQRQIYHAHEQRLRESVRGKDSKKFNSERIAVLAELTRLRELCCDPHLIYEDYDGTSAKLETILELIENARDSGAKCLVFSQFTTFLELIAGQLESRGIGFFTITGATPKRRRVELVDTFNRDTTPVFLVSLKAGGTGLNLTGASVVIHADPWWNSAAENQATDRSHRIGQTKEVVVYKVIAKNTVEERVVDLQAAKRELADKLVNGTEGSAGVLTQEELLEILSE